MRIVFFGTTSFSAQILEALCQASIEVALVVCPPDKPQGRSQKQRSPFLKQFIESRELGIPIKQCERSFPFVDLLSSYDADFFVVAAYGEIIRPVVLDIPRYGSINVHASLLPEYRGASPIQRSIMEGRSVTGITIMRMDAGMDTGAMLLQKPMLINPEMNYGQLSQALGEAGGPLLVEALLRLKTGTLPDLEQDGMAASYAAKTSVDDAAIDWRCSATTIHNLVRAMAPSPGAWSLMKTSSSPSRVKIFETTPCVDDSMLLSSAPGIALISGESLLVRCGEGCLSIDSLQMENRARLTAASFLRGCKDKHIHFLEAHE